jgi:hypothetical protein
MDPVTDAPPERAPRKAKSPGRVAAAKRLNELGLRGVGGRKPVHGLRALAALLGRGEVPAGPIGAILASHEGAFLSDLGGRENVSSMEVGLCRRLAETELFIALIRARLTTEAGGPRRLPWAQEKELLGLHARLADSFTRTASALGLKKRAKELPSLHDLLADPPSNGNGASEP